MTTLLAVLGSVTPPSRLHAAMKDAVDTAAARAGVSASLLDLGEHRLSFADGRPLDAFGDDTAPAVARVAAADAVILASPVYRGSFTGALKNLLDHLPVDALAGKPVGIVAMGASAHHYLGVDWHLRDVLAWFGAIVVPTSVYLASSDFSEGVPSDAARCDLDSLVKAVLKLTQIAPATGEYLGPRPLAARRG